jgi:hypothetical protein
VADLGLPRGFWRLGRVVETYKGKNNRVRAAKVRTTGRRKLDFAGTLVTARTAKDEPTHVIRSVNKLCLMRAAEEEPALSAPPVPEVQEEEVDED